MITIISPTTTLDFNKKSTLKEFSVSTFNKDTDYLVNLINELDFNEYKDLMNLSDELTKLNKDRFNNYYQEKNDVAPCFLAYDGEVFNCMNVSDFNNDDIDFANNHLRVLSGLYGALKPLDLIRPHRLEMKATLSNNLGKNLYSFWKNKLTEYIDNELLNHNNQVLVNLASSEYTKALNLKEIKSKYTYISIEFKEYREKTDSYKVIGLYSKKARGYMVRYIIKNKIDNVEDLKKFNFDGYIFNEDLSTIDNFIFTRG